MTITNKLPKNFEITLNDLARAREKAAKQKYLLDLGESLVMHLCSFVLGEYKATEKTNIELEKSFVKNNLLNPKSSLYFSLYQVKPKKPMLQYVVYYIFCTYKTGGKMVATQILFNYENGHIRVHGGVARRA
jgi:energy-converting hydrogenase Eha subunit G